jgi:hypothetical protein
MSEEIKKAVSNTNAKRFSELIGHMEPSKINEEYDNGTLLDKAFDKYTILSKNYLDALQHFRNAQIKTHNSIIIIQELIAGGAKLSSPKDKKFRIHNENGVLIEYTLPGKNTTNTNTPRTPKHNNSLDFESPTSSPLPKRKSRKSRKSRK